MSFVFWAVQTVLSHRAVHPHMQCLYNPHASRTHTLSTYTKKHTCNRPVSLDWEDTHTQHTIIHTKTWCLMVHERPMLIVHVIVLFTAVRIDAWAITRHFTIKLWWCLLLGREKAQWMSTIQSSQGQTQKNTTSQTGYVTGRSICHDFVTHTEDNT